MEVINVTNNGTKVDLQFLQKGKQAFEKRPIEAITVNKKDGSLSWMPHPTTVSPSPTSKIEIRRGFKGPSPLKNITSSDTPTTEATSRGTEMTMRGRSISPSKAFLGESPIINPSESVSSTKSNRNLALEFDFPSLSDYVPSKGPSRRSLTNPKLRQMSYPGASRSRNTEDGDFHVNPEPVPFQPQNFLSATMMKKIPIPKRHMDTFGGMEYSVGSTRRGVILHTDRYQWENARSLDGLTQRERLRAELDYMEKLRGIKRRREILPHRAKLDLLMGGTKVEFAERFDIQREIAKLKSLVMPTHAKDLYHGRGIQLPSHHSSIKPKKPPILDYDSDEDCSSPAYLKRSRTNINSKFDSYYQRSYTAYSEVPEKLGLKITPNADNVRRVDIPSASVEKREPPKYRRPDQPPSTRGSNRTVTVPTPFHEKAPSETATDAKGDIPDDDPLEMDMDGAPGDDTRSKLQSPMKAATPNPLKGSELTSTLPEHEKDELKATFKKLDTDSDGHIKYNQLQSQLPKNLSTQQEKFLKEVYDITSSSTFFGVDEFLTMSSLTSTVTALKEEAVASYSKIDFSTIHNEILRYVETFQSVDRNGRGKIALEGLQEVLSTLVGKDFTTDTVTWNKVLDIVNPSEEIQITKIEFLAHIPYFITLKS